MEKLIFEESHHFETIDLKKKCNWTLENASLIAQEMGYQNTDQFRKMLNFFILNTVANSKTGSFLLSLFLKDMKNEGVESSKNNFKSGILKPE